MQGHDPALTSQTRDLPVGLSPEAVEGRLIAHRTVLALLLTHLQRDGGAVDLMEQLDSLSVVQDHQEDPGSGQGGPEVIQGFLAQEIADVVLAASPERSRMGEAG